MWIKNYVQIYLKKFLTISIIGLFCNEFIAQTETKTNPKKFKSTFNQQKEFEVYANYGFFKTYKNTLSFYNNKMGISFTAGHTVQGLTLSSKLPDIQLMTEIVLTYDVKSNIQIYALGKYVDRPINNSGESQSYMNPLFEQSEFGMGIKASIDDLEFDIGPKLILDTQSLNSNNSFRINTKISKKF
ncbi:hypothetical protein [Leeuwenhoekiella marinoflava]|uniref:hypothetical protein n=1 Tax=Leeuwenhoekiella marinoflava TaxID=988 RepID=UPI003001860E